MPLTVISKWFSMYFFLSTDGTPIHLYIASNYMHKSKSEVFLATASGSP
jgi:hypothetical protein